MCLVCNLLSRSRVPSLTTHEVTAVLPGHTVLSRCAVCVGHSASTIRPEGIVETVVCACGTWGSSAGQELSAVERERKGASDN